MRSTRRCHPGCVIGRPGWRRCARLRKLARVGPVSINLSIWLFFLSGGIRIAAFLPAWVQTLAAFTRTYYGVHALQMSIFLLIGRPVRSGRHRLAGHRCGRTWAGYAGPAPEHRRLWHECRMRPQRL